MIIFKDYPEENNIDEKAGLAYANLLLPDEGQNLIEKAGFVRIRFGDNTCMPH
ncbi:hypothetical protein NDI37_06515 [Funiculus sociatus GB2-A5]|uniref:Uncharacterized protein n=1 Tax=Funiculus sociatus GB2-A5 TaxID=2933946 RepID=A0ABV0JL09_9CYAN|nr:MULTISPECIES: hypothetical protein [unclassified Trichocoleus]MBD1905707.1 hypothetical protein [Trichocoleus sp. FACHB-832]MBD2065847.1 hypothetical protein [Trichocoleus sp. FACHB-6]